MSDDMFFPGVMFGIFCAGLLGILLLIVMGQQSDIRRDLFLSYCTAHGDKYEVCAKAWEEGEM